MMGLVLLLAMVVLCWRARAEAGEAGTKKLWLTARQKPKGTSRVNEQHLFRMHVVTVLCVIVVVGMLVS